MAEDTEEQPEPAAGGGNNKMLLIVVGANMIVVLLAVGGVFFAMSGQAQPAAGQAVPQGDPTELGPLIQIDSLVVNLDEQDATHYLRAAFQLEVVAAERQEEVNARMVPIRNGILLHLSSLGLEDTQGRDKREALLERIEEIANEAIGTELIRRVYFSEFVVQ